MSTLPKSTSKRISHRLTFEEAIEIYRLLDAGEMYSRIAARYDVNQGRIAEVKFGRLHPGSRAAADQGRRAQ